MRRFASTRGSLVALTGARSVGPAHPKADVSLGKFSYDEARAEFERRGTRIDPITSDKQRKMFWRVDEYARRGEAYLSQFGPFFLPTIDFPWYRGCAPLLSSYQIRLHYTRHHRAYVEKLNALIKGTRFADMTLDNVIAQTAWAGEASPADVAAGGADAALQRAIFNNAAQHYNHCFFWKSIAPLGSVPPPDLVAALSAQYGSLKDFEKAFQAAALAQFGSGWVYLVYDTDQKRFDILSLGNAGCPLTTPSRVPLLCIDVWEHAYYVDYENDRAAFAAKFFDVADYHWAERHWKRATGQEYHDMKWL